MPARMEDNDTDYFNKAMKNFKDKTMQVKLF